MAMSATGRTVPSTRLFASFRVTAVAGIVPDLVAIEATLALVTSVPVSTGLFPALDLRVPHQCVPVRDSRISPNKLLTG